MDDATKERLRAAALKKRGVLLKDVPADEFGVAVDYVQDNGTDISLPVESPTMPGAESFFLGCYLRYATKAQVEALATRLPHARKMIPVPGKPHRPVVLFNGDVLRGVLDFLVGKNARKYWNWAPDMLKNLREQEIGWF